MIISITIIVASAEGSHFPSENPDDLYTSPLRINAVMFILVLQGTAKVGIDFTLYTLMNPSLLMIMPTHTIQVYSRTKILNKTSYSVAEFSG